MSTENTNTLIAIDYTLHTDGGDIGSESVQATHVPRVGELVSVGFYDSYQVVDVLWHINDGRQHRVSITACERSWHRHIEEVVAEHQGTGMNPAPDDARHFVELMQLITWHGDPFNNDADSAIPERLGKTLDQDRWSMLDNGLLDWDTVRRRNGFVGDEALFRLAVIYTLPIFEGAPTDVDHALGELLAQSPNSGVHCESPEAVSGFGRRWREDLCATAWRLALAHHRRREQERPS